MGKLFVIVVVAIGVLAIGNIQSLARDVVYHGCVNKKGDLRIVIRGASKCKKGETHISWNQAGPQGEQGLQGLFR